MPNICHRPSRLVGVPVVDSDESFPETGMGSTSGRQSELLLLWDQQLWGMRREMPPFISLLFTFRSGARLSCWDTLFGLHTFCCLTQVISCGQFKSATLHLLLCERTNGLFTLLWPLSEGVFLLIIWLGYWGRWSLCDTSFSCVTLSLFPGTLLQTGRPNSGDVWAADALTAAALTECFSTKTLSSFRASSTMPCFLSWSSLRRSRLFFMYSRFEASAAVASPFWKIKCKKNKTKTSALSH